MKWASAQDSEAWGEHFKSSRRYKLIKGEKMASDKRPPITLVCTETGDHNYVTTKNKTNTPDRLEMMKYSPRLRKHTLHREKR